MEIPPACSKTAPIHNYCNDCICGRDFYFGKVKPPLDPYVYRPSTQAQQEARMANFDIKRVKGCIAQLTNIVNRYDPERAGMTLARIHKVGHDLEVVIKATRKAKILKAQATSKKSLDKPTDKG